MIRKHQLKNYLQNIKKKKINLIILKAKEIIKKLIKRLIIKENKAILKMKFKK